MNKEQKDRKSIPDLKIVIEDTFKKTLTLLKTTQEFGNTKKKAFLRGDFIDHQFTLMDQNFSLSKTEHIESKVLMLYRTIQKGPFSPKNIAEGFVLKNDEATYTDYTGNIISNSQEAFDKINEFIAKYIH